MKPALLFLIAACTAGRLSAATAVNDAVTLHSGQKALVEVLANDTGAPVASTVAIVTPPAHGTAQVVSGGKILYTHGGGGAADQFRYSVASTGGAGVSQADVAVTVATGLRIGATNFNVPAQPPASAYQTPLAFGDLPFSQPLCLVSPPGDTQRLFICEKTGLLRVIADVTAPNPPATTFLNLPEVLSSGDEAIATGSEMGLLGLAFHPDYATNRYFYLFYSVTSGGATYERVSRFTTDDEDPLVAEEDSELILLEQRDDAGNHNGGDLHFGPDGYLYVSLGDEGGGDDTFQNSQRIDRDFFSGILRIDVDKRPGNLDPHAHAAIPRDGGVARFSVPADNPFVHTDEGGSWDGVFNGVALADLTKVRSEFWAVGLRNPWRMAFDSLTGDLWCGDVGQNQWEEIDLIVRGGNYGWSYREGTHPGPHAPVAGFSGVEPVWDYAHGGGAFQGNCVTGGIVYRGNLIGSLYGAYVFADYSSGNIWSLRRNDGAPPTVVRLTGAGGIAGIGRDPSNGDVLFASLDTGRILRLTATPSGGSFPQTLTGTKLFADLTDLSPSPGLLPYSVNVPFWSDHAVKRRWFALPGTTATATWAKDAPWTLPEGMLWVKHFDLELERGNPASARRIETRLLVRNAGGIYGVSYKWNPAGTEATLVDDAGEEFDLAIDDHGTPHTQRWHIPSRAECRICHNDRSGRALSFNTRQLNLVNDIHGFTGNQLTLLRAAGYLANEVPPPETLPRHLAANETDYPVEGRVRSYLAVNCAYCHQADGTAPPTWDGRAHLSLAQTKLIDGVPSDNHGDPLNVLVKKGDTAHSIVWNRVAVMNGFTRMPPIASTELDPVSIDLLEEWISTSLPTLQTYADWRSTHFGVSPNGAPAADPDHDGRTNHAEFLAGTSPTAGNGFLVPSIVPTPGSVTLGFTIPAHRSFQVETSGNLVDWLPWAVSGNGGLPRNAGAVELEGPPPFPDRGFFRVILQEQ